MVVGALHEPFQTIHMGVTAENIAAKWEISRDQQNALAIESQNRAQRATEAGSFKGQIMPIMLRRKKGDVAYALEPRWRDWTLQSQRRECFSAGARHGCVDTLGRYDLRPLLRVLITRGDIPGVD